MPKKPSYAELEQRIAALEAVKNASSADIMQFDSYMSAMHETTLGILTELDLATLLKNILQKACGLLGTQDGYIFLYEEKADELIIEYGTGKFENEIGFRLKPGEGLSGKVWQSREVLKVDEYDKWDGRHGYTGWNGMGFDLGIPLKSGEKLIGVMGLCSFEKDKKVGPTDEMILCRFAELAAIALHNARLHSELRHELDQRRLTEEALRESEAQFRSLFENAPVGIGVADSMGNLLIFNKAMLEAGGYSAADIQKMGRDVALLYRDTEMRNEALRLFREQGFLRDFQAAFKRKDGSCYDAILSLTPVIFNGHPAVQAIVEDITYRKQAEAESEKLQAQLIQAQKIESVGRLAGGVAHDFNNMLAVIIGNADLALQHIDSSSPVHSDLLEIKSAARRSAVLTRQLLAFARRQTAAPIVLDLNNTVAGMLSMLRRLIGENIDLAWMPGANLWPVKLDPAQVDQIIANLCVNARDAIGDVGKITIETHNAELDEAYCASHPECFPGAYVILAVSDDGCGMTGEIVANLFEPFFTTKRVGEGTGLGLSTVYGIVKQNEGFINVYSEPGHGATLKLYIPRTHGTVTADKEETAKAVAEGTETVLIVEDEDAILRMGKAMLERYGYTALAARGPEEALEIVERFQGSIDLLITDVVMPDMNGQELKMHIRKRMPKIKVLFMSGYTANVILHRGILQGNVNFIEKPFSADSLAGKVREVLDPNI